MCSLGCYGTLRGRRIASLDQTTRIFPFPEREREMLGKGVGYLKGKGDDRSVGGKGGKGDGYLNGKGDDRVKERWKCGGKEREGRWVFRGKRR